MAQQIQAGLKIIALRDGTSVNGYLRVENTPLIQRYNDAGVFTPDYETLAEDKRPVVVPILVNVSDGALMTPQTLTWKYNGVELAFGEDNLSTNEGMEGVFKRLADYSTNYDGSSKTVAALRVMKNLVPISGYDNDRISASGTIEIGGSQIAFDGISTDVVIQKSTGSTFDLVIADGSLTKETRQTTLTAHLWNEGSEVTDLAGYTFEWKIVNPDGSEDSFTTPSTNATQTVVADDVDYQARVRCTVKKGTDTAATGFCTVTDYSDPAVVAWEITGITGGTIQLGQTATIKPVAKYRDSGATIATGSWTWNVQNNDGESFELPSKGASTFTAESVTLQYSDAQAAGYGINFYVSTTIDI